MTITLLRLLSQGVHTFGDVYKMLKAGVSGMEVGAGIER